MVCLPGGCIVCHSSATDGQQDATNYATAGEFGETIYLTNQIQSSPRDSIKIAHTVKHISPLSMNSTLPCCLCSLRHELRDCRESLIEKLEVLFMQRCK